MRTTIRAFGIFVVLFCQFAFGQDLIGSKEIHVTPGLTAPKVSGLRAVPKVPGVTTRYYWVITNMTSSIPSLPVAIKMTTSPATLSATTYNTISWFPVIGAYSYDVLRTATATSPTGDCGCAVATGLKSVSVTDIGAALKPYKVLMSGEDFFWRQPDAIIGDGTVLRLYYAGHKFDGIDSLFDIDTKGNASFWGNVSGTDVYASGANGFVGVGKNLTQLPAGDWDTLKNKPVLSTVATSGSYLDLLNKPAFSAVATSGSYTDLSNKPSAVLQSDVVRGYVAGAMTSNQVIAKTIFPYTSSILWPIACQNSNGRSFLTLGTAATSQMVFSIKRNGTQVASATIPAGGISATFICPSNATLTPIVTDSFTTANTAAGVIDANWTSLSLPSNVNYTAKISTNKLVPDAGSGPANTSATFVADAVTDPNQYVSMQTSLTFNGWGLAVRVNGTGASQTAYYAYIDSGGPVMKIFKTTGLNITAGTLLASTPVSILANDTFTFYAIGNSLGVLQNANTILQVNDNSYATGKAGFAMHETTSGNVTLDNAVVGSASAAFSVQWAFSDVLTVVAPSSVDATAASPSVVLYGEKQ